MVAMISLEVKDYTISVCGKGYAQQVAELRQPSPCSQDDFCISWQPSGGTLCCV